MSFSLLLLPTRGASAAKGFAPETDVEGTGGSPMEVRAAAEGRAFITRVGDEDSAGRVVGASDEDEGDGGDIEDAEGWT